MQQPVHITVTFGPGVPPNAQGVAMLAMEGKLLSLGVVASVSADDGSLKPMTVHVVSALGLEMLEHDACRDLLGMPARDGRRVFTAEDLQRGASLGPVARLDHNGILTMRLEA